MLKKLTYVAMIISGCVGILGLLIWFLDDPEDFMRNIMGAILGLVLLIAAMAGFTQLLGRAVIAVDEKLWAFRLAVVLSVLWFLISIPLIGLFDYDYDLSPMGISDEYIFTVLVPLSLFWGTVWIFKGVKK